MPEKNQVWDSTFLRESAWLRSFAPVAQQLASFACWPTLDEYTGFVEERRARLAPECCPVRFVAPKAKRQRVPKTEPIELGSLYDGSISLRSEVPCFSASYHDLFNVLIWAAFPRAKRALHARQFRALAAWLPTGASKLPGARTREQDALTVFDEGGSVVVVATEPEAPVEILLFGHALLEHALYRRPKVRSCALVLAAPRPRASGEALLEFVDRKLSERLNDAEAFQAPGMDAVAELTEDGSVSFTQHVQAP